MNSIEQQIKELLASIPYGEKGNNILDQEIVYSVEIEQDTANVILILSEDEVWLSEELSKKVEVALTTLKEIGSVKVQIFNTTAEADEFLKPPVQTAQKNPNEVKHLQKYKHVILIASGKGGVGKSTVSVNLAIALKSLGKDVSLMDADVFGPSLATMLGTRGEFTDIIDQKIQPMHKYGVNFISLGNLVPEDNAMIWRGPMVHSALEQLMRDTEWPGGDFMLIDLPPGTGDVQLSISQMANVSGAVIVCTPQDVALLDAKKALQMFDKIGTPVVGMIENMSSFICPDCGTETPIFSKGGAENECLSKKLDFLGAIPIELDIRIGGDEGKPVTALQPESMTAEKFRNIAKALVENLD